MLPKIKRNLCAANMKLSALAIALIVSLFHSIHAEEKEAGAEKDENGGGREEFYIRGGSHERKGWIEAGLRFRPITNSFNSTILIQVFHGYGESLISYDEKETTVRAGLILL